MIQKYNINVIIGVQLLNQDNSSSEDDVFHHKSALN